MSMRPRLAIGERQHRSRFRTSASIAVRSVAMSMTRVVSRRIPGHAHGPDIDTHMDRLSERRYGRQARRERRSAHLRSERRVPADFAAVTG